MATVLYYFIYYKVSVSKLKAIILAAGRGSRLHPYTEHCPKCLTEIGDISLIERQIQTLRGVGVTELIIVTGYRAEMLSIAGTQQVHNPEWQTTNMVESLFCAESEFGDDIIVSYSDIVYERRILKSLLASKSDSSIVVDQDWETLWRLRFEDPLSDAETLRMEDGRIVEIGQKASCIDDIEAQYIGLMRFRGAAIAALRAARARILIDAADTIGRRDPRKAYMTDLLTVMIAEGIPLTPVVVKGGWLEIDTVSDYETVNRMSSEGTLARFYDMEAGS